MKALAILKEKYAERLDIAITKLKKALDLLDALIELHDKGVFSDNQLLQMEKVDFLKRLKLNLIEKLNSSIYNRSAINAEEAREQFLGQAELSLLEEVEYIKDKSSIDVLQSIR